MHSLTTDHATRSFTAFADPVSPRHDPSAAAGGLGTVRIYERAQRIYAQDQATSHFYQVRSGAVSLATLLRDGHRQIVTVALAGDIFGLEASKTHGLDAEALTQTTLIVYRSACLSEDTPACRRLAREASAAMLASQARLQDHVVLLGRRSAGERISAFLCRMADRLGTDTFDLPMSRSDIADHLGLTIESVSRSLTSLAQAGTISSPCGKRTITVLDKRALLERNA